jgi:CheY-like chemotaxis protein
MAVAASSFDVILMNIQMPEMDGVEATQAIRALPDPSRAQLPIVAVTAHCMKGDAERFLRSGMNDYLPHPVRNPEFVSVVEAVAIWAAARDRGEVPAGRRRVVSDGP